MLALKKWFFEISPGEFRTYPRDLGCAEMVSEKKDPLFFGRAGS